MKRVFSGLLSLVMLGLSAPTAFPARGKTIKGLSGPIPLGILQRSAGPKFYQSLLVSPLDDWSVVRAQVAGTRLSGARVIRSAVNPAYNSLALKFANEMTLVANDRSGSARQTDSALIHLLIYQIADGVMAVSFGYLDTPVGPQMRNVGSVRLSVKTKEGRWTEIRPPETRQDRRWSIHESGGRSLRKIDRIPIHSSFSGPR